MKRVFITCILFAGLVACNSSGDNKSTETKKEEAPAETSISDNPDYQAGLALIAKNGCLTCHKVDEKLTGPSYREVANKYASEGASVIPKLAEKIIKGGSGVWGEVPMIPHPAISQADAETMVKYIMLLKK